MQMIIGCIHNNAKIMMTISQNKTKNKQTELESIKFEREREEIPPIQQSA